MGGGDGWGGDGEERMGEWKGILAYRICMDNVKGGQRREAIFEGDQVG